jgi:hypothetical protein
VRTPDAVIIGAQKAATTGLLRTLAQHPRVTVPRAAEVTALHSGRELWEDWVANQEPQLAQVATEDLLVVKLASAMYFSETLASIKQLNPAVRVVALLRHPVDRILSQYLYAVQHGLESRPVEQALDEDRVERSGDYRLRTYSEGSRYAQAIERIRSHFDPEQVLYVDFETAHARSGISAVENFLDLEDVGVEALRVNVSRAPRSATLARAETSTVLRTLGRRAVPARWRGAVRDSVQRWNASSTPPPKPRISEDLRGRLLERHAPDTTAAEGVLSKDLSHWRR